MSEVIDEQIATDEAALAQDAGERAQEYTPELVEALIEELSGSSRRKRQDAGFKVAEIAHNAPTLLESHIDALIDALYRPEAQTRWEMLDALTMLAQLYGERTFGAFDGAEASLFDEDSSTVRLSAFLFLTRYAAAAPEMSDAAWPILDEAIQCFHGDPEYRDMLVGLLEMAQGDISQATAAALAERVGFDAENGVSFIKIYSNKIIGVLKGEDADGAAQA